MAGVSKVTLIGNLGRDPETRYTPSGAMNVQFSMAVTRKRNDASGNPVENTTWFRVTAWRRLAETLDQLTQNGYLAKGKQVYVLGTLEMREYTDANGQQRQSLDVNADEVQLLGSRSDSMGPVGGGRPATKAGGESDGGGPEDMEDVPF